MHTHLREHYYILNSSSCSCSNLSVLHLVISVIFYPYSIQLHHIILSIFFCLESVLNWLPMHDDHRRFTSTTSFILQRTKTFSCSVGELHPFSFRFSHTILYTNQSDSNIKGGDPAAGSPTATLLRLLPRCWPQVRWYQWGITSPRTNFDEATGGVCKEQGRIHRAVMTRSY